MLTHSSFLQVLLRVSYIDLTRVLAFHLVHYQGVATDIPILTFLVLAVAREVLEVKRCHIGHQFGIEVLLKDSLSVG
jgi:hypothetical protein